MGKEATIGLAVILILLITFGVVLVQRLSGSTDPAAASSAEGNDKNSSKAEDDPAEGNAETKAPAAGPGKRRILAAKPVSSRTSRHSPAAVGQFAVVSDADTEAASADAGPALVSPPSMMPNPPAPAWADPHGRYGSRVQQAEASQVRQLPPIRMLGPAGDSRPYDPFEGQTAQTAVGSQSVGDDYASPNGQAQVGQTAGGLRSLGPPRQTPRQSGSSAYDYRGPGRYSAGGSAATQTPAWRQTPPYTYLTPSQQARTLPVPESGSNFGPPYGAKNFRNAEGEYEIQPNDSYWVISQKLYGSGAYFKALAEHNRSKVPREDRLAVGEVLSAPSVLELEKAYPDLCPKPSRRETVRNRASLVSTRTPYVGGRIYVVEEGDTLFDIARYELGKASRWVEIHQLNRDLVGDDADYISPGMQLVLPDDEPSERVTQRPRSFYPP